MEPRPKHVRRDLRVRRTPRPGPDTRQVLSVIIPVKNGAATLPDLLDALARQKQPPGWEVEIVAGYTASRDDTLAILERHGVTVAESAVPGPSAGRNMAVRKARGTLLYFIDADAAPLGDDFFVRLVAIAGQLEQRGRLGGFGGPILLHPKQSRNPIALADHFACWFNWTDKRPSQSTRLFQPTVSMAMPRAVYQALGGFDEDILILEDFELQARMQARGLRLYFINELRVLHRARDTLARSWRHSWSWGTPYQANYLARTGGRELRFPLGSPLFFLNLPFIFARRMKLVMRAARQVSPRGSLLVSPLIAATVFAWALAVVIGDGRSRAASSRRETKARR
jgi:GT2 family glycosyltransferase